MKYEIKVAKNLSTLVAVAKLFWPGEVFFWISITLQIKRAVFEIKAKQKSIQAWNEKNRFI